MNTSESTGFITMCKRPLQHQSAMAQQSFASLASNAAPIGVHRSPLLFFTDPISPTSVRLRNVTANLELFQIDQRFTAVVALVGDQFRQPIRGNPASRL